MREREIERERVKEREIYRDTDKCILFEIKAGIEPAVQIHLAYSIDTLKLRAKKERERKERERGIEIERQSQRERE